MYLFKVEIDSENLSAQEKYLSTLFKSGTEQILLWWIYECRDAGKSNIYIIKSILSCLIWTACRARRSVVDNEISATLRLRPVGLRRQWPSPSVEWDYPQTCTIGLLSFCWYRCIMNIHCSDVTGYIERQLRAADCSENSPCVKLM